MILSPRLKKIYDLIDEDKIVLDVGSDHGYLAIELMKNKRMKRVRASEFHLGPFKRLEANINRSGLDIEVYQADGLEKAAGDEDIVVISGMGSALIVDILKRSRLSLGKDFCPDLILEPQTSSKMLRSYLHTINYRIKSETYLCERHKYYPLILASYDEDERYEVYQEEELEFGRIPLKNRDPNLFLKLQKNFKQASKNTKDHSRASYLQEILSLWTPEN